MRILIRKMIIMARAEDGMRTGTVAMTSKVIILSNNNDMKGLHHSKGHRWKGDIRSNNNLHYRWNSAEWNAGVIMEMAEAEICSSDQMRITSVGAGLVVEEMVKR
jgi:hypothetical protein